MIEVNETAEAIGWARTLETKLKPKYPKVFSYVTDFRRADWRPILPITKQSRVLDLGSGWGSISFALAPHCGQIVSLEGILERAHFTQIRKRGDGISNMHVIAADSLNPPLPDSYFDIAVVNGLLEWVGLSDDTSDPLEVQKSFLKKVFGLLKPGGWIYIGIENRWGYPCFLGAIDHSGLKYTSLMPRKIADIYSRIRKRGYRAEQRGYRTYTHSYWKYRSLLAETGFSKVDVYSPMPGYNEPYVLAPLTDLRPLKYYFTHLKRAQTLRSKILFSAFQSMPRLLTADFSIIGQKEK